MTDVWTLLYAISVHVLLLLCTLLVFDKRYEDGLFGRLALVAIALAGLLICSEFWARDTYAVYPTSALLAAGFALFMARHVVRFSRVRWRCPSKVDHGERRVSTMPAYLE